MSESFIFSKQLRKVKEQNIQEICSSKLFEPQMGTDEANTVGWKYFESKMKPLSVVKIMGTNTECIITPKSIPWVPQDVNIYVGGDTRDIFEIKDLSDKEGKAFLYLNLYLAKNLLSDVNHETHVSIGFNPDDFSSGHHSMRRLHSHIYVADSSEVDSRVKNISWNHLNKSEKLTFIEPFSQVYYEYIINLFKTGRLDQELIKKDPENNLGYVSFYLDKNADVSKIFSFLKTLYEELKKEYAILLEIFTDKSINTKTQRYVPRNVSDRNNLLAKYLDSRVGVFSEEGSLLLQHLSQNLQESFSKEENIPNTNSEEQLWITKGLAGAFTFSFNRESDLMRIDFLPRVLTTATVDKTILGKDRPTKVKRTEKNANVEDLLIMEEYHKKIIELASQIKDNNILG